MKLEDVKLEEKECEKALEQPLPGFCLQNSSSPQLDFFILWADMTFNIGQFPWKT